MIKYYLFVNILSATIIFWDKHLAKKHHYRIPENTLLSFFLLGGFLGGYLSMWIFHHKTKKFIFHITALISAVIHITVITLLL